MVTFSSKALSPMPTPAIVPPVPAAQVKPSIRCSSCSQISRAVLSIWALRLAILSNWLAQIAPSFSLLDRGLLDRPSAPLLGVNGKLDDLYVSISTNQATFHWTGSPPAGGAIGWHAFNKAAPTT